MYRPVPAAVRARLGAPGYMAVLFGAPDPLDEPGGYRYEISEEDRRILENAVKDTASVDVDRRGAAFGALQGALLGVLPVGALLGVGGVFLLNLLGKLFSGSGTVSDVSHVVHGTGYFEPAGATSEHSQDCYGYLEKFAWNVSGGVASWELRVTVQPGDWSYYEYKPGGDNAIQADAGRFALQRVSSGGAVSTLATAGAGFPSSGTGGGAADFDYESYLRYLCGTLGSPPVLPEYVTFCGEPYTHAAVTGQTTIDPTATYRLCAQDATYGPPSATTYATASCKEGLPKTDGSFDYPPGWTLENVEDAYEGDPAGSDVTSDELQRIIDHIKIDPDYAYYRDNPEDPFEVTGPGGGGGVVGGGPGGGGNILIPEPPDFWDGDGNLNGPYLPGKPITPCLHDDQGNEFCQPGQISEVKPPQYPGGPVEITPVFPPYANEFFEKARCYNNERVVVVAKQLAEELGLTTIQIDETCTKRWTGCFKKGSSKFDALWKMMDLCGYDLFPDPGEPKIAPIKPINVFHGPYDEYVNLFAFEPTYDNLDVPYWVEYYRPHFPKKRGWSVRVKVQTIYAIPQDKILRILAPPGTSQEDGADLAAATARKYGLRALRTEFVVPLNLRVRQRHQVRIARPSRNLNRLYYVADFAHDVSPEGYLTRIQGIDIPLARELGLMA